MAFDYRSPHPEDALNLTELDLYHMIMEYREANGEDAIPLSLGLTTTAGRHAADTAYNFWAEGRDPQDVPNANSHSWSDLPYKVENGSHVEPEIMWEAPQRVGTTYPSAGYEISVLGGRDIDHALELWQGSAGHNVVLLNQGAWANLDFNAIGIGVVQDPTVGGDYGGNVYHVWFGSSEDPDGAPEIVGGSDADVIEGTAFDDAIRGKAGPDVLNGGLGEDDLGGGNGSDQLFAGEGADDVFGGNGRDLAFLGEGHDVYTDTSQIGVAGQDSVYGGRGRDSIASGGGKDLIDGGKGADWIAGGRGGDTMTGGAGVDTFYFGGDLFGRDVITDWDGDRIEILGSGEAKTQSDLSAALTETAAGVLYDHLGDNLNTILFRGVTLDDLELSYFDLA